MCDICEGEDCGDICIKELEAGPLVDGELRGRDGGGSSAISATSWLVIVTILVFVCR